MTAFPPAWGYFVLVITSGLLFKAALTDLREYKIRNEMILALIVLFVLYIALTGRWADLKWDVPFAVLMFAILLVFYSWGWLGGGDVKILAVAFLWTGSSGALVFALLLSFFSGIHTLAARFGWAKSKVTAGGRRGIPFGPSVAAALICTFMLRSAHLT